MIARGLHVAVYLMLFCSTGLADCEKETDGTRAMGTESVQLVSIDGRALELSVLIADDGFERAMGFQHICPEVIDETAILFVFSRVRRPSFHMRNVKAPLDIAFIDADATIAEIQRMEPYVLGSTREPHYSPASAVAMALETRAGFFTEHNISAGWRLQRP